MRILIVLMVLFVSAGQAIAQDPGARDTVIVGTVFVDLGQPYVDVPVFAVTDDTVSFYNLPLTWDSPSGDIFPSEVIYDQHPIEHWEVTDSILLSDRLIRLIGWDELDWLFLLTNGVRWQCFTLRFVIDSTAPPQIVPIDTTYDYINGELSFGLRGGVQQFTPVFVPGAIYYGITSDAGDRILPEDYYLLKNYPNPFNVQTIIEFNLPEEADVELAIYDLLGREIAVLARGLMQAGTHQVAFNAGALSSGVYFYSLRTADIYEVKRMILLK